MDENMLKFVLKVFIVVIIIFALIVFINRIGLNLNTQMHYKKLLQEFTIEGLKTISEDDNILNTKDAFCESHRGSSNTLDDDCKKLTKNNCTTTSCCVYTSENKCVAGNQGGPTFNSDEKGKTKNLDYYYYQEKCYGAKCPK